MDALEKILAEIAEERKRQDELWGVEFDRKNTLNDWGTYIGQYTGYAAEMGRTPEEQRDFMLKVAALAVAALEAFDRNNGFPPRHYDE